MGVANPAIARTSKVFLYLSIDSYPRTNFRI
jgi:hypothetical protein